MGCRCADGCFIVGPVDVDIATVSVDFATSVYSGLGSFKPEYSGKNPVSIRIACFRIENCEGLTRSECSEYRESIADLLCNEMSPQWRLKAPLHISRAISCG